MIKWLKKKTKEFVIKRVLMPFLKRFLMPFLLILILVIGLTLVVLGPFTFNLEGPALITVLILGGLLIGFAIIRLTINSIAKNAIEREEAKKLREKLEESEKARRDLALELKERKLQPLRIRNIQPILDMGILEVDFELTKFFDQQYEKEGGKLKKFFTSSKEKRGDFRFIGGLIAKFRARYGIDLLSVKVLRDNENRRFYVSGVDPVFRGTSDFPEIHWQGSIMLGYSLLDKAWEGSRDYSEKENQCKEEFREIFQRKLKAGPEELNFIKKPLQEYMRHLFKGIFAPQGYSVELVDEKAGKDFILLTEYLSKQGFQGIEYDKNDTP